MTRPHFVFDFDDTLVNFTQGFCEFVQRDIIGLAAPSNTDWMKQYGSKYDLMTPFRTYDVLDGVDGSDILREFDNSGQMLTLGRTAIARIYENAVKDKDTFVTILTARRWMRDPEGSTKSCLAHNNLPMPDHIEVVGGDANKSHYVAGLKGEVAGVIDDSPWQLTSLMQNNPKGAVIYTANRPWNRHIVTHMRVDV